MSQPRVRQAAVMGSGVMGAAIAAHLANAGIPARLYDLRPRELTDAERARGLSLDDPAVATRIAAEGLARATKASPAPFFTPASAALVTVGHFDDLSALDEADWIVEAIVERLDLKQSLWSKIAAHARDDAILSTNTSGISVAAIAEALPKEARRRFLATHFFNPPRYLKLLELVPGPDTDPDVVETMARFGEERLGKGIVHAKDTPNFIANRIGVYGMVQCLHALVEDGYTVAEIDALTGPLIGRPRSATFRTADVVGLDTLVHVADNMADQLPDDPERHRLRPPGFLREMVSRGMLGEKSGGGFYRKTGPKGARVIEMLDPTTLDYVPVDPPSLESLAIAGRVRDLGERVRALVNADERGGRFLWRNLSAVMTYAARSIPEISDDVANVDRGMQWGFGWRMGPFETWDAIGVADAIARLDREGARVPDWVRAVATGGGSFYRRVSGGLEAFDPHERVHVAVPADERVMTIADRARDGHVLLENDDAVLVDLGEAVAALSFKTKMNTINRGVMDLLHASLDHAERHLRGLVIANDGDTFSAGADLTLILGAIDSKDWSAIDEITGAFQCVTQRLTFSSIPVVVAPRGLTIGGGCEILLGADRVRAAAESYVGLVEVGAGVIPAGGGCKEMLARMDDRIPRAVAIDPFPFVRAVFETLGMGRVSTSAPDARELGFLRPTDGMSMNGDHLLRDARDTVIALQLQGYRPPRPRSGIRVVGGPGLAALRSGLHNMRVGQFITEYDVVVGDALAWTLCGGDLSGPAEVSESYLLRCEREAFGRLCRDERTRARMLHVLETGKPLRN